MKIIGKTTFGALFLTFYFSMQCAAVYSQTQRTLLPEEQVMVDNHTRITREEYIYKWRHLAFENREQYGIPVCISLGQAILESGYGNSHLAIITNNHFNIKCKKDWTGRTKIWEDDIPDDCFRVYDSVEESYRDYAEYISSKPWYDPLFSLDINDYKGWAKGLKEAGYATDPKYPEKLIGVIESTHIYLLDAENGIALYDKYMAEQLGLNPDAIIEKVGIGSGIEQSTQQTEQPEAPSQTTTEPQSYDDTTKAYANNGVDPNNFRVTINAHHGYNVYLTNGSHYVVAKENDSYASIAKLFEISEATLRRYNDVSSTTPLKKGDLVYIERKSARWQGDDMLHIVSEGQTPHILSQIYGIRLSHLLKMNRLRETSTLSVGQSIRLR